MKQVLSFILFFASIPSPLFGSDSFLIFPRGQNLNFELSMPVPPQTQTTITILSSTNEPFPLPQHQIPIFAELAPTIGHFINDIAGTDITTIPMPYISSQTLELLMRMVMSGQRDEILSIISNYNVDIVDLLFDEAQYLESDFLKDIVREVREARRAQEPQRCENYSHSEEDAIYDDVEDPEEEISSESDELESFLEDMYSRFDDVNYFPDQKDFEELNQNAYNLKGKKLGSLLRFLQSTLIRRAALHYTFENDGETHLKVIDTSVAYPKHWSHVHPSGRQHLYSADKDFHKNGIFQDFNQDSTDSFYFILHHMEKHEIFHFEGPLAEVFDHNENVANIFNNLIKSLNNHAHSLRRVVSVLEAKATTFKEKSELLRTSKVELLTHRYKLLKKSIADLDSFTGFFRKIQPNLMSAYLVSEFFQSEITKHNDFYFAKPSAKFGKKLCDVRRDLTIEIASFASIPLREITLGLLLPYMNQFLAIVGEKPREITRLCDELKAYSRIQVNLIDHTAPEKKPVEKKTTSNAHQSKKKNKNQPSIKDSDTPVKAKTRRKKVYIQVANSTDNLVTKSEDPIQMQDASFYSSDTTSSSSISKKHEKKDLEKKPHGKKSAKEKEEAKKKQRAEVVRSYQTEKEKREKEIQKFQGTLSREDAEKVRSGLSSKNQILLALMFTQPTPNKVLTDSQIADLAKAIQIQMNRVSGIQGDAGDFLEDVLDWIHVAHDSSDTGDKLPAHYVDILRMVFIMYGLAPEGWEPKTREDRSAVKYL